MAIPSSISQLSTNPALNPPNGATDSPSTLDDYQRAAYAFIAQIAAGTGFTVGLGMPVKTGENSTGGITIGYRTAISKFVFKDGATEYVKVPIDISGKADTAGAADTATTAANANQLGGVSASGWARNTSGANVLGFRWDAPSGYLISSVDGNEFGGVWPIRVAWANIISRPTDLASFTNSPGFQTSGQVSAFAVQRIDSVTQLGNVGSTAMRANVTGFGFVAWGVTPSDARLKTDISPTGEDSLSKIKRIDFRQFRFRQDVTPAPIDDGRLHRLGVIAQELEAIDPEWVNDAGTWKAPDQQALLYAALHAIKQQQGVIAALQTRIQALEERA